jgi:hypothetical protein
LGKFSMYEGALETHQRKHCLRGLKEPHRMKCFVCGIAGQMTPNDKHGGEWTQLPRGAEGAVGGCEGCLQRDLHTAGWDRG